MRSVAAATGTFLGHPLLVLRRQKLPRGRDHLLADNLEISFNQRTSRSGMPATAELLRELVDVDVAGAAKRNLDLVVPEVAEEERQSRAADRARVLGDSFQILGPQAVLLGGAGSDR